MRAGPPTITECLDPRRNGLNLLRLVMASGVVFYHAFALMRTPIPTGQLQTWLQYGWVDGFFVLSGYLIVGSWLRRPHIGPYLRNRLLRIYPAFLVCLVVTAFVFAPIGAYLGGETLHPQESLRYVLVNLGITIRAHGIDNTLHGVPFPYEWNGSLWTLTYEFSCYLVTLVLGVLTVLRRRWGIPLIFAASWWLQLQIMLHPALKQVEYAIIHEQVGVVPLEHIARFAIAFSSGALIHHLSPRLPCTWPLVGVAAALVVGSLWLPEYRVLGALPLAYALVCAGALLTQRWAVLREDISYGMYIYGYPIQQLLILVGVHRWGYLPYVLVSLALTAVFARASWMRVEKPILRLKAG